MAQSISNRAANGLLNIFWWIGERAKTGSANSNEGLLTNVKDLRRLLRRFPYWAIGHKRVAEISLTVNDIPSAYAAAQCLRALSGGGGHLEGHALLLIGSALLRYGDWQRSLAHLERAEELLPANARVWEEKAAAHMAGSQYKEAYEILSTIPDSHLTPEGRAALEFLSSAT